MNRYKDINHRSTVVRTVCTTATNSVSELVNYHKNGMFDYLATMEFISYFHGTALVACQVYAVGTVSDINKIRKSEGQSELSKVELYKTGRINPEKYGYVELINSLANYFKHNEEWGIWPNNETTRALREFGINESSGFPLSIGISKILAECEDLRGLCRVLEDWRFWLLEKYC